MEAISMKVEVLSDGKKGTFIDVCPLTCEVQEGWPSFRLFPGGWGGDLGGWWNAHHMSVNSPEEDHKREVVQATYFWYRQDSPPGPPPPSSPSPADSPTSQLF